ncbi:hypothetical protein [Haloferax massiliensis]|uniref:Glycosyltransferase RgtA/B/C/D-like domain-containing protein n=1 Tax=Haloferax massiliensis TaxID=1476858 RepID=A0A0D6JLG6_9EURY|nr:hypothetical protein [Haloferax massiliensis]CQR48724.1 hypothetical protein BN996_00171 [Haloferax massiliensis]
MNKIKKLQITVACLSITTVILSIRQSSLGFIILGVAVLLFTTIRGSQVGIAGLAISTILLFPGAQAGWLYRRGSHNAAYVAMQIQENGWPLTIDVVRRAFPATPLLHMLTIVLSKVTNLSIMPGPTGQTLITYLLSIILPAMAVIMVAAIAHRYSKAPISLALLPVLAWIPGFIDKTAFNRQSFGFVIFLIVALICVRQVSGSKGWRWKILLILSIVTLVGGHHFSAIMGLLIIAIAGMTSVTAKCLETGKFKLTSGYQFGVVFLLGVSVFATWFIIQGLGAGLIVSLLVVDPFTSPNVPEWIIEQSVTPSQISMILSGPALWLFQVVLAIGCMSLLYIAISDDKQFRPVLFVTFVGATIAVLGVLSRFITVNTLARIFTFFVFVGGWAAIDGYQQIQTEHRWLKRLPTIAVTILLVIGIMSVPIYYVSDVQPTYENRETDQQYPSHLYATGDFLSDYPTEKSLLIGDDNVEHVVGTQASMPTEQRGETISQGRIPEEGVLVLRDYNNELYFGSTVEFNYFAIKIGDKYETLNRRNTMIYDNGNESILLNK